MAHNSVPDGAGVGDEEGVPGSDAGLTAAIRDGCGCCGKIDRSADAPGSFPPAQTKATQLWTNLSLPK